MPPHVHAFQVIREYDVFEHAVLQRVLRHLDDPPHGCRPPTGAGQPVGQASANMWEESTLSGPFAEAKSDLALASALPVTIYSTLERGVVI